MDIYEDGDQLPDLADYEREWDMKTSTLNPIVRASKNATGGNTPTVPERTTVGPNKKEKDDVGHGGNEWQGELPRHIAAIE